MHLLRIWTYEIQAPTLTVVLWGVRAALGVVIRAGSEDTQDHKKSVPERHRTSPRDLDRSRKERPK